MEIFWVILVLQAFICGGLSSNLAERKGYSYGVWFASGFFLGIFGLIAAAGLPTKPVPQSAAGPMKKCPDCAETIRTEALVCRFCGYKFSKDQIIADLIENLQDKSISNRLQAIDALLAFKDESAVSQVIKLVESISIANISYPLSPEVRLLDKATRLLIETGTPEISTELAFILKETDNIIKANKLIEILGSLQNPSIIPILVESLHKQELRDSIANLIYKYGEAALPHLERLARDGKRSDRKLAEQIITRIKSAV